MPHARNIILSSMIAAGVSCAIVPGCRADWRVVPSIALDQSFTDNARLAPDDEAEWDLVTGLTPAVTVRGAGARARLDLDAAIQALQYWRDEDQSTVQPRMAGSGTIAVVPELLFVDARASVRQVASEPGEAVSGSQSTAQTGATVAVYQVSPYLRNHFAGFADSQIRYSFSQVLSSTGDLGDATTHELNGTLVSGTRFPRLAWRLTADAVESDQSEGGGEGSRSLSSQLVRADVEYAVSRPLALLAGIGYERIEDDTLDDEPNGPIGSFGFRLRPGPRTTLVLQYNHRFDRDFATGELDYKLSEAARVHLRYAEGIQTSQTLLVEDLGFLTLDEAGNLIDARTAALFGASDVGLGLSDAGFRQKRLDASFDAAFGRDAVNAYAYYDSRTEDATDVEEVAFGASLSWEHALDRTSRVAVTARFRQVDFGDQQDRTDDLFGAGLSLSHSLSESAEAVALYSYTNRLSTDADSEFVENVFTVGLRKSF